MDQCPYCGKVIPNTPESDNMASRLNLAEERLHGVEGENQRLGARIAELEGALIAIEQMEFGWVTANELVRLGRVRDIARAALGVE